MIVIECKATSLDFLLGKNLERKKKKSKTFHLTHEKENNNVNFLLNINKYLEEALILFLEKQVICLHIRLLPELSYK